ARDERGLPHVRESRDDEGRGRGVEVGPLVQEPVHLSQALEVRVDLADEARKAAVERPDLVAQLLRAGSVLSGPLRRLSQAADPFLGASHAGEGALEAAGPERLGEQRRFERRGGGPHEASGLEAQVSGDGRRASHDLELCPEAVAGGFVLAPGRGTPGGTRYRGSRRRAGALLGGADRSPVDLGPASWTPERNRRSRIPLPWSGLPGVAPGPRLRSSGTTRTIYGHCRSVVSGEPRCRVGFRTSRVKRRRFSKRWGSVRRTSCSRTCRSGRASAAWAWVPPGTSPRSSRRSTDSSSGTDRCPSSRASSADGLPAAIL